MKNSLKIAALLLISAATFTSCSKEKKFAKRLEGTWTIDKATLVDSSATINFTTTGSTFNFKEDGKGEYTFAWVSTNPVAVVADAGTMTWDNTDDEKVTMVTTSALPGSDPTTWNWTVTTNEKESQVWEATLDGDKYTLNFSKK
jgi:ABC-type amino acid transport substrate-binding protein